MREKIHVSKRRILANTRER